MKNFCSVILCGGKGSRMGSLTKKYPKNLLNINKRNKIIDQQIKAVLKIGIKKVIFPTGYKNQIITKYLKKNYSNKNFIIKNTGINTSIGERLIKILKFVNEDENILLLNGDTLIDFDLKQLVNSHLRSKKLVTASSYNFQTNFGLIKIKNKKKISFEKKVKMENINFSKGTYYVINSGITIINRNALDKINFKNEDFEEKFYNIMIKRKQLNLHKIKGKIYQFDTPKDLENFKLKKIKV